MILLLLRGPPLLGVLGLSGERGEVELLVLIPRLLVLIPVTTGILFQGGITFLDESGCMVTSGRKTIVLDRFMSLDIGKLA